MKELMLDTSKCCHKPVARVHSREAILIVLVNDMMYLSNCHI